MMSGDLKREIRTEGVVVFRLVLEVNEASVTDVEAVGPCKNPPASLCRECEYCDRGHKGKFEPHRSRSVSAEL